MNISDRLISILSPGLPNDENVSRNRTFLFNLISYTSIAVLLIVGLRFLYIEHFLNAIFLLSLFILIALVIVLFPPNKHYQLASTLLCIILGLAFTYTFYFYKNIPNGWFWFLLYPVFVVILLGTQKGIPFSLILPVMIIPGMLFPKSFPGVHNDINFFISILTGYLSLLVLMYFNFYINKKEIKDYKDQVDRSLSEAEENNRFISNLSHQLRTSLSNIILANNLVSTTKLDEKQKEVVDTLQASTNNLAETINKIVDVSHPQHIPLKEVEIPFNLKNTLESIIRLYRNNPDLKLDLHFSSNITHYIVGDPVKVKQIFLNIIQGLLVSDQNMKQEIGISVSGDKSFREHQKLQIFIESSIKNSADSESPESDTEKKIFSNYDPDHASKLVSGIGGSLVSEKKEGKNIVKITLRVKVDPDRQVEKVTEKTIEPGKQGIELKDANVLLVEDNVINQKIVILSIQDKVRSIEIASNGKEALDKFVKSRYDIVLMDIQMPVMDGMLATKKIREVEESTNTKTPIIAITANALSGDREKCLAVGMDDYIAKPFQMEVLLTKMKDHLKNTD